jgi:GTPase involved in cell partitioning and DNA repair
LGISVLLFDLAWELVLMLWRALLHVWRLASPFLLKLIPNFIGNFVTQKLLPLVADVVPIIKDDHRVLYLRFNIRRHIRRTKAWLYLKSRARRDSVRKRLKPWVSNELRARKSALLNAVAKLDVNKEKNNHSTDEHRPRNP